MQAATSTRTSLVGTALPLPPTPRGTAGPRKQVRVEAYQKNRGKVKGGYGGTEPNAKQASQMSSKSWADSSGRASKGIGAYRFTKKYGDINDYSPIYDEYTWASQGDTYPLGTQGLTAWGGLLAVGLLMSVYLVYVTSQLAS